MITPVKADKIIRANLPKFKTVVVDLAGVYGRILCENIFSDRDQPPFNKSVMDGIAVRFCDWQKGCRQFKITGVQAAGDRLRKAGGRNTCVEIMTGAAVPAGYDCVIPVENVTIKNSVATARLVARQAHNWNIRRQGSDRKRGEKVLEKGTVLLAPQLAIAASVGKIKIKVAAKPRVAVISTGDELVDIRRKPKEFQTRTSNAFALKTVFDNTRLFETKLFHLKDNQASMRRVLRRILRSFDAVVLSGGVSMGKFDFVPQVLKSLKVKVLFHKVRQKPGKPFWFGKTKGGKLVFALPGNPVSTLVCAFRYALPQLKSALGIQGRETAVVSLNKKINGLAKLTYFCPVKIKMGKDGRAQATPFTTGGSGDFAGLAGSDGFVELPAARKTFLKNHRVVFYPWKI